VDALSRNPVGAADDDDFGCEIQDLATKPRNPTEPSGGIFSVQCGKESDSFGLRRRSGRLRQHYECCFGINHWRWPEEHQLYMLEVLIEASQDEKDDSPGDGDEATVGKEIRDSESSKRKQILRRGKTKYYDRKQQLELVLVA